jgi:hypothetical protein
MSMDTTALLSHSNWGFRQECLISIAFGTVMVVVSFLVDCGKTKRYVFWGYLFGMLTLWGGLSLLDSGDLFSKLMYACLNGAFIFISVLINRRVFLVFGAIGVFGYFATLAHTIFRNSMMFPFALSVLGAGTIAWGVLLQRHIGDIKDELNRFPLFRALVERQG